LVHPR